MTPPYVTPLHFCSLAGGSLPLRGIGSSEADADAVLIDLEPQAALFVILGDLLLFGKSGCQKPLDAEVFRVILSTARIM